jgi:hypothetical protein
MRFTLRLLSWNAAAYALLALAPIIAHAQTALSPETHGIVIANMDARSNPVTISTTTPTAAGSSAPKFRLIAGTLLQTASTSMARTT